jgi:nucleotide-binding universal stress UspA family protein
VHFVHGARGDADAAAVRGEIRDAVAAAAPDLASRTEVDVLHGALTDRLLDYLTESQADLVLVGGRRRRLAARLAMVAPCAVAMLPDGASPAVSHLLVAVDFSHDAADTLRWATSLLADQPDIRCTALHVMTHESTDIFAVHETPEARMAAMRELLSESNRHGVDVVSRLAEVDRDGAVHAGDIAFPTKIQHSDVAHTILAEAAAVGADCLALSTRGRSRSASILLGSVVEMVIERTTVPLLVGKPAGRRLSLADILLGRAGRSEGVKAS